MAARRGVFILLAIVCVLSSVDATPAKRKSHDTRQLSLEDSAAASSHERTQRQAAGDQHDVVDFGAHTGDHGAFGWYADFPVHSH